LMIALVFGPARTPTVASNSTLFLRIQAPFPEVESNSIFAPFVGTQQTLRTVLAVIDRAQRDDRVRGMVVIPNTTGALWAQVQEIHDALEDFKKSGKSLVVFMEYGGATDYLLASAAERDDPGLTWVYELYDLIDQVNAKSSVLGVFLFGTTCLFLGIFWWFDGRIEATESRRRYRRTALQELRNLYAKMGRRVSILAADIDRCLAGEISAIDDNFDV